jgi:hypothetical protein
MIVPVITRVRMPAVMLVGPVVVVVPVAEVDTETDVTAGGRRWRDAQRQQCGQRGRDQHPGLIHDQSLQRRLVKARSISD